MLDWQGCSTSKAWRKLKVHQKVATGYGLKFVDQREIRWRFPHQTTAPPPQVSDQGLQQMSFSQHIREIHLNCTPDNRKFSELPAKRQAATLLTMHSCLYFNFQREASADSQHALSWWSSCCVGPINCVLVEELHGRRNCLVWGRTGRNWGTVQINQDAIHQIFSL